MAIGLIIAGVGSRGTGQRRNIGVVAEDNFAVASMTWAQVQVPPPRCAHLMAFRSVCDPAGSARSIALFSHVLPGRSHVPARRYNLLKAPY